MAKKWLKGSNFAGFSAMAPVSARTAPLGNADPLPLPFYIDGFLNPCTIRLLGICRGKTPMLTPTLRPKLRLQPLYGPFIVDTKEVSQ